MRLRSLVSLLVIPLIPGLASCRSSGSLAPDDGGLCPTHCAEAVNLGGVPLQESGSEYDNYVALLCCSGNGAGACCSASGEGCSLDGCVGGPESDDGGSCGTYDPTMPPKGCGDVCGALFTQHGRMGPCCLQCLQAACPGELMACLDPSPEGRPAPPRP